MREAAYLEAARATLAQGGDRFAIVEVAGATKDQYVYNIGLVDAPGFQIKIKVFREGEEAKGFRRLYVAEDLIKRYGSGDP